MSTLPSPLSASDARTHLYDLIEESASKLRTFTVIHKGTPKVAIIPFEELEGWQETLEIMSDPRAMKQIRQAEKEIKQGKTIPLEDVIKMLDDPSSSHSPGRQTITKTSPIRTKKDPQKA